MQKVHLCFQCRNRSDNDSSAIQCTDCSTLITLWTTACILPNDKWIAFRQAYSIERTAEDEVFPMLVHFLSDIPAATFITLSIAKMKIHGDDMEDVLISIDRQMKYMETHNQVARILPSAHGCIQSDVLNHEKNTYLSCCDGRGDWQNTTIHWEPHTCLLYMYSDQLPRKPLWLAMHEAASEATCNAKCLDVSQQCTKACQRYAAYRLAG